MELFPLVNRKGKCCNGVFANKSYNLVSICAGPAEMTENRRIVLNIVSTYGRSLFAFACGVFGGRWALMALGEVD